MKLEKMNQMYRLYELKGMEMESLFEVIGCKAKWVNCAKVAKVVSRVESKFVVENRALTVHKPDDHQTKILKKKGWKLHKPEDAFEARITELKKKYFREKFV